LAGPGTIFQLPLLFYAARAGKPEIPVVNRRKEAHHWDRSESDDPRGEGSQSAEIKT
jgi:hypothetical protein